MCPIVNLTICDNLYEKYVSVRREFDSSQFSEEPHGVIRFRSDTEFGLSFWTRLGFKEPLLCYVFSNTPEYKHLLKILKSELSVDELGHVSIYNAETGERFSLAMYDESESVLLAVHAKPSLQLERKILSIFNPSESNNTDEGRESRTRTRNGLENDQSITIISDERRPLSTPLQLDDFEQEFLRQVKEQEKKRKKASVLEKSAANKKSTKKTLFELTR